MKADVTERGDMDLTPLDERIIDELRQGARTQGYLVDAIGETRHKIHPRLQILNAVGYIDKIHDSTALYELREDPREEGGDQTTDGARDV